MAAGRAPFYGVTWDGQRSLAASRAPMPNGTIMENQRSPGSAITLFVGIMATLGTFGILMFEGLVALAVYLIGVLTLATWLSVGTYRN